MIQIAFDRYLLPSTITRQSYAILDSRNQVIGNVPLRTIYDPVARTVTIAGPDGPGRQWLTPDQAYKLFLPVAPDPKSDIGGFRAIDRAALYPAQNREIVFRAGPPKQQTQYEPEVDFCADVLPLFVAKCSGGTCHGSSYRAAAGLILETSEGVRSTARGRVAQGSNTAGRASTPEATPPLFGANMEIVRPGDPGSSWLMYKLELARPPRVDSGPKETVACTPPAGSPPVPAPAAPFAPLAPAQTEADEVERSILDDFVLGREMPYPNPPERYVPTPEDPSTYLYTPLDFQERERIRIWIARGAAIRECGGCIVRRSEPAPNNP